MHRIVRNTPPGNDSDVAVSIFLKDPSQSKPYLVHHERQNFAFVSKVKNT